jgi:hypothetical protein
LQFDSTAMCSRFHLHHIQLMLGVHLHLHCIQVRILWFVLRLYYLCSTIFVLLFVVCVCTLLFVFVVLFMFYKLFCNCFLHFSCTLLKRSILCDLFFAFCALLKHFLLWCSCFVDALLVLVFLFYWSIFTLVFLLCWSIFCSSVLTLLKHISLCWNTLHFGVCASCFTKCFVAIFFVLIFRFHDLFCSASPSSIALLHLCFFFFLWLFFVFIYMSLFFHVLDGFCFLIMFIGNGGFS